MMTHVLYLLVQTAKAQQQMHPRRDHHHQVAGANQTQAGVVELATGVETLAGVDTTVPTTPFDVNFALDERASDTAPVNTASADAGTATDFARDDHDHGIDVAGGAGDGTVLNGNGAPAGNSGEDGDSYRTTYLGLGIRSIRRLDCRAVYASSGSSSGHNGLPSHRGPTCCGRDR